MHQVAVVCVLLSGLAKCQGVALESCFVLYNLILCLFVCLFVHCSVNSGALFFCLVCLQIAVLDMLTSRKAFVDFGLT